MDVALEAACRAGTDDRPDSECAEGPHVGPVVDAMGRDRMPSAVAGHECHPPAGNIRQEHAVGRGAVWRVDLDLADVLEQRVEARPTEDPDLRAVRAIRHVRHRSVSSWGFFVDSTAGGRTGA